MQNKDINFVESAHSRELPIRNNCKICHLNITDNLISTNPEPKFFMNIERLKNVKIDSRQIQLLIPANILAYLKETADRNRKAVLLGCFKNLIREQIK